MLKLSWPVPSEGQRHGASELPKIAKYCTFLGICPPPFRMELKRLVDHDRTGPSLQLVGARFSNFLPRKLSYCEVKLRGMSILHEFEMAILPYCLILRSHGRACCMVLLYVLRILIWPLPDRGQRQGHWLSQFPQIALFYVYLLRHFGV